MGQPIYTKLDYCIDDELLEKTVHTEVGPNYHKVMTRWVMKEDLVVDGVRVAVAGELMREDAAPSMLAGPGQRVVAVTHGKINGRDG